MTKELQQAAQDRFPIKDGMSQIHRDEAALKQYVWMDGATSPAAKAYHEAQIIKKLQREIKGRIRYTNCSMPITEDERVEKHGVEEYDKAIEDVIVILAKHLPSPPKTDKQ